MPIWLTEKTIQSIWPFKARAAIFDFDGTLANSLDVWKRVDDIFFERRGITYNEDFAQQLSVLGFEEGAAYTIETYGLSDTPQAVCDEWNDLGRLLYKTDVNLRPGAEPYLRTLAKTGIPMGLATTNRPHVLNAAKDRIPFEELFSAQVYGCELERPTKRDPDIYFECARRLGIEPCECVVFEDIPTAIKTAKSVGMTTVAVLTDPQHQDKEAVIEHADYVIPCWTVFNQLINS